MTVVMQVGLQVVVVLLATAGATVSTYYWHPKRPALYLHREALQAPGRPLDQIVASTKKIVWIDVRSDQAFEKGHIPAAISMNASNLDRQMVVYQHLLSQKNHFAIYGDSKSAEDVEKLQSMLLGMGFPMVDTLKGGWRAWETSRH